MTSDELTMDQRRAPAPAPAPAPVAPDASLVRQALLLHGVQIDRVGEADPWEPAAVEHLEHLVGRVGPRPYGSVDLITVIERAGLTGHGGAHVPAAAKWRKTLRGGGPLTVVANGAESEPLSAKDSTLLQQRPHLVLDGLATPGSRVQRRGDPL